MDQQGIPMLHEDKFSTWKMKLESYFRYLDENIFLSVDYGVKDNFNDKLKEMISHGISRSNKLNVKHCEIAKEMLDRLQILYLGRKL